jgi:sigma-B regulation protein RsbU (phosphoserine phosphatase)
MDTYLDDAPCLFFTLNDEGLIGVANSTLCRRLGYAPSELNGIRSEKIFPVATRIFMQTHLFPLLRMQGSAEEIFITLRRQDGTDLPVLVNASRSSGEDTSSYAGIVVQHRKEFEQELIAARNKAEAALRENTELMAARNELQQHAEELDRQMQLVMLRSNELQQFNRVVTHDVQEPLRKLSVFSNMLHENSGREDVERVVEKVRRVTGQLREIISGLQQFVWLNERPLQPATIELERLLPLVQQQLAQEFPGVRLVLCKEELVPFRADWEQLQLLFYQVLHNALRFRKDPDCAEVRVAMSIVQRNQFRSVEGKYKYVDFLRIEIEDRGIGFEPVYRERALELFKRLHPQSGRGMGLALCNKIAGNHGGDLQLDSKPGAGTCVTLLLPGAAVDDETGVMPFEASSGAQK